LETIEQTHVLSDDEQPRHGPFAIDENAFLALRADKLFFAVRFREHRQGSDRYIKEPFWHPLSKPPAAGSSADGVLTWLRESLYNALARDSTGS